MKKIIVFIISLTLLSCLDISDPQAENIDEMEERTKNLEDSIVGLIETGITFLNKELKENLKAWKVFVYERIFWLVPSL